MSADAVPQPAGQPLLFDTSDLGPPEQAFARYCALIAQICDATVLGEIADFRVTTRTLHLGHAVLLDNRSSTLRFDRTAQHVATGMDHFQVTIFLGGGAEFIAGSRTTPQRAGDVCLIDMSRPNQVRQIPGADGTAHVMTFMVPRMLLVPLLAAPEALPAISIVPRESAEGRLIGERVLALRRDAASLTQAEGQAAIHGLLQQVALAVGRHVQGETSAVVVSPRALRAQIRRHIEENLGAAALGVEGLCQRFNMSRASLYRLFAPHSPASYIQERRLHRAFAMLNSPAFRSWRILDVALECHFSSNATFDRAFRRQFGLTPGEARALAGRPLSGAPPGRVQSVPEPDAEAVRWVTTLTGAMPYLTPPQTHPAHSPAHTAAR